MKQNYVRGERQLAVKPSNWAHTSKNIAVTLNSSNVAFVEVTTAQSIVYVVGQS